jgi:hypothetical protein
MSTATLLGAPDPPPGPLTTSALLPRKSLSDEQLLLIVAAASGMEWRWVDGGLPMQLTQGRWQLALMDVEAHYEFASWHLRCNRQWYQEKAEAAISTLACFWTWHGSRPEGIPVVDTPCLARDSPFLMPLPEQPASDTHIVHQSLLMEPWPLRAPGDCAFLGAVVAVGGFPASAVDVTLTPFVDVLCAGRYRRYLVPPDDRLLLAQLQDQLAANLATSRTNGRPRGTVATMGDAGCVLSTN